MSSQTIRTDCTRAEFASLFDLSTNELVFPHGRSAGAQYAAGGGVS